jgi:hypothetical protein
MPGVKGEYLVGDGEPGGSFVLRQKLRLQSDTLQSKVAKHGLTKARRTNKA